MVVVFDVYIVVFDVYIAYKWSDHAQQKFSLLNREKCLQTQLAFYLSLQIAEFGGSSEAKFFGFVRLTLQPLLTFTCDYHSFV